MASNYSKELADMLKKYIYNDKSVDNNKLRQLLQETSVAGRCKLLREVNITALLSIDNGIWRAAWANDINTLKSMMDGFTSEQAAALYISSALRTGAFRGSTEVVEYLLALLNQDQRVEVLMKGDSKGNTALHGAIRNKHLNTAHVILASVEPSNQMKLLQIKNNQGQSVEDLPAYSLLTPTQANAKQQKASGKEIAQLQTELTKQKEEIARQKRAFTQRFNQQEEANAKQQKTSAKEIAQLQSDTVERERVLDKRTTQLEAANVEQQRASAKKFANLQTEMTRQERAFTQRINQQEEEMASQGRAFTQRINQQEEELAKQKRDNVKQQRVSAEVIAQLQSEIARQETAFAQRFNQPEGELAKQKQELAKQKEDNVEQQRVSAEVIAQLQTDNVEQRRVSAEVIAQLQTDIARQERAFTQRFNQQEEEIHRLVENFNRFEVYLKTPEVSDARGDQEIEDNH